MAAYQSALAEAAHKVTSRRGWPNDRVERFVALTDAATASLCTSDATSIEFVIDHSADGLRATVSAVGGKSKLDSGELASFETAAKATADHWTADSSARVLTFLIS